MVDLLQLSSHLPEVDVGSGDEILREGERTGAVWILVSGELRVRRGATVVDWIDQPGSVIGEMAVLLDIAATASSRQLSRAGSATPPTARNSSPIRG